MKKIQYLLSAIVFFIIISKITAQERNFAYTNLFNQFVLNPALAGSSENITTMFNTRSMVGGIAGGARSYNFSLHSLIKKDMGIGIKAINASMGIFNNINVEAAYAKGIKINDNNTFKLGMSVGFSQTNIQTELLNGQVDLSDRVFNHADLNMVLFSTGVGLIYSYKKTAEIGISLPHLISGNKAFNQMLVVNSGYTILNKKNQSWQFKPMLNLYSASLNSTMVDALFQTQYKNTLMLTSGYRTNGSVIIGTGLSFNSFAIKYAYYHHVNGLEVLAPAQNEIAVSFGFNRPNSESNFRKEHVNDKVITDEISKVSDKLNGLLTIDKSNPGLINLRKELVKLNKELNKLNARYFITNTDHISKINSIKVEIESLLKN